MSDIDEPMTDEQLAQIDEIYEDGDKCYECGGPKVIRSLLAEVRRQREELNKANSLAVERLELLSKLVERMDFLKDANVRPFLLVFDVNNGARHIDTADAIRALNHVRAAEAPHE